MAADVVIPVVFPDYLIHVDTPPVRFEVPDLPLIDIPGIPDRISVPGSAHRVPYLGHAGVAYFDGATGTTKYYEYGRYDPAALGIVRKVSMPNVTLINGKPTEGTLMELLRTVSRKSGQNGAILGCYIELPTGSYAKMLKYSQRRLLDNSNASRAPYSLMTNSCCHFMRDVAVAGGATMPWVAPPNPSGYIRVVRAMHPELDYARGQITVPALGYPAVLAGARR
ncbi:MAG: hypothetical protein R2762_14745 [Bryobacteraceae bacterium]